MSDKIVIYLEHDRKRERNNYNSCIAEVEIVTASLMLLQSAVIVYPGTIGYMLLEKPNLVLLDAKIPRFISGLAFA